MAQDSSQTEDFYCDYVLSGKLKVKRIYETNRVLAFHHTKPSYPFHVVIIPKAHIPTLLDLEDAELAFDMIEAAKQIIKDNALQESSYRLVTNGGSNQDSHHFHLHLISGDKLG